MATTRDHTEIPELRKVLNLDVEETKITNGVEAATPTTTEEAPAPKPVATAHPDPVNFVNTKIVNL